MKLSTIQKRNKLNEMFRSGDPGPGGAYHDYDIYRAEDDIVTGEPILAIQFRMGARKDPTASGIAPRGWVLYNPDRISMKGTRP